MDENKHCPCCEEKLSFWSYFYQDNFRDSNEERDRHIKCKSCNQIILLSTRKRTITNIGVLVIFIVSMFLFIEDSLSWAWVVGLLLFICITSYLSYKKEKLICYDSKLIEESKEDNMGGIIFAIIILVASLISFWNIFSFALMKQAENKQKQLHQTRQEVSIETNTSLPSR